MIGKVIGYKYDDFGTWNHCGTRDNMNNASITIKSGDLISKVATPVESTDLALHTDVAVFTKHGNSWKFINSVYKNKNND